MRCPLHVAAGTCASLPVIQMLTQAYPNDGKTPLTLTCDAACELFEGDRNSYEREPPSCSHPPSLGLSPHALSSYVLDAPFLGVILSQLATESGVFICSMFSSSQTNICSEMNSNNPYQVLEKLTHVEFMPGRIIVHNFRKALN